MIFVGSIFIATRRYFGLLVHTGWGITRRIKSSFRASLDFHMQNKASMNECCMVLNNMNFKSLCIQTVKNRFPESGIIKSGFLLAFVFSLLSSLSSDNHRFPLTYHV